jgi:hypothetical protein
MNALVPIALTLSMPDQLPVGGSFTMGSSWALTDEARIWGRTPSVQASMSLDFGNISMGGISRAIAGVVEAIPFRAAPRDTPLPPFEFDLPGQNFVGVPFTQVYPDGLPEEQAHCWAFDCSYNGTIEAVWNGAASAINAANDPEITQNNENVDDWDTLTQDETFFDAQQYPNLIMTQQVYQDAEKVRPWTFSAPLRRSEFGSAPGIIRLFQSLDDSAGPSWPGQAAFQQPAMRGPSSSRSIRSPSPTTSSAPPGQGASGRGGGRSRSSSRAERPACATTSGPRSSSSTSTSTRRSTSTWTASP